MPELVSHGCRERPSRRNQQITANAVLSDPRKQQLRSSFIVLFGECQWLLSTLVAKPDNATIDCNLQPSVDPLPFDICLFDRQIYAGRHLLRSAFRHLKIDTLPVDVPGQRVHLVLVREDPAIESG